MSFLHRPTLLALGVALFGILLVNGCNTVHGVGQDVESAGRHIERAAR